MLHLAQVNRNSISHQLELQLLARRTSDRIWLIINNCSVDMGNEENYQVGMLVLVELDDNQQIINIQDAKGWILEVIKKYSNEHLITPEFVAEESERIEQWRQEITAQSLDLTRRNLEIETRRDQLQELELTLKQEKEKLENRWQQLQKLQEELHQEKENTKTG